MSGPKLAYQFIIAGKVQGVGFRYFTQSKAQDYALNGWVRNLIDGRVEALAVGDEMALNRFAIDMNRGPESSHVISVERHSIEGAPEMSGFNIEKDGEKPWQKD
tara:strand:+ start:195096 stop:195407 length:312 start_codon:yes stop_codon:yes gene_type:complete